MQVTLINDSPFGKQVRVLDHNNSDAEIFSDYIGDHSQATVECRKNDAGYGYLVISLNTSPPVSYQFLKDDEPINL